MFLEKYFSKKYFRKICYRKFFFRKTFFFEKTEGRGTGGRLPPVVSSDEKCVFSKSLEMKKKWRGSQKTNGDENVGGGLTSGSPSVCLFATVSVAGASIMNLPEGRSKSRAVAM